MSLNLYIHVPFCVRKCPYCAFYSVCGSPDWVTYENEIINELDHWANNKKLDTIFFGGGTPSLLPTDTFARIMEHVRICFDVTPNTEITLESNPGTLNAARLGQFMRAGVNRLSVGAQSFDDDELQFLGRIHNADDALRLIKTAQDFGLNVSADFIYALPQQKLSSVEKLCRQILNLDLRHASLYELTIERDTPFAREHLRTPKNEVAAIMYETIGEMLAAALPRYEVSNYARAGCECRHNINVWNGNEYIGVGDSAAGRIIKNDTWFETKYMHGKLTANLLTTHERAIEKIITGMRTTRGVMLSPDVTLAIDHNFIEKNRDQFIINDNRIAAKSFLTLDDLVLGLIE